MIQLYSTACRTFANSQYAVSSLQTVVSKYGSQFRGNSQHDALEFLLWLLDRVHEDINLASHNNNNRSKAADKVRMELTGKCT